MGYYINKDSKGNMLPTVGKAVTLQQDGATVADVVKFQPNLVCVVSNGLFEAAGLCITKPNSTLSLNHMTCALNDGLSMSMLLN